MTQFDAHISSLRNWSQCRRKFLFTDANFMDLEPLKVESAFFKGRMFHRWAEIFYSTLSSEKAWTSLKEYFQEEVTMLGEEYESQDGNLLMDYKTIKDIIRHYELWIAGEVRLNRPLNDSEFRWISFETKFKIPVYSPVTHRSLKNATNSGRIDGIVEHIPTKKYYVWENKTSGQPERLIDTLGIDSQAATYMAAVKEKLNVPLAGCVYNIVRSQIPENPSILKNGNLSKTASLRATGYYFLACVKKQHPTWTNEQISAEYGDYIEQLIDTASQHRFFTRLIITKNEHQLSEAQNDIHAKCKEILNSPVFYHTESPLWCGFCAFKKPCEQMTIGETPDFSNFRKKLQRQENE